jgi:hypothetical protein
VEGVLILQLTAFNLFSSPFILFYFSGSSGIYAKLGTPSTSTADCTSSSRSALNGYILVRTICTIRH